VNIFLLPRARAHTSRTRTHTPHAHARLTRWFVCTGARGSLGGPSSSYASRPRASPFTKTLTRFPPSCRAQAHAPDTFSWLAGLVVMGVTVLLPLALLYAKSSTTSSRRD
jgi:hypothetical protein